MESDALVSPQSTPAEALNKLRTSAAAPAALAAQQQSMNGMQPTTPKSCLEQTVQKEWVCWRIGVADWLVKDPPVMGCWPVDFAAKVAMQLLVDLSLELLMETVWKHRHNEIPKCGGRE
jgi:hypothetical protein